MKVAHMFLFVSYVLLVPCVFVSSYCHGNLRGTPLPSSLNKPLLRDNGGN